MQEQLDKIIENLEDIKRSDGYLVLIFMCFISSLMTCHYTKEVAEEQHKTNMYLKMDYNKIHILQDSTFNEESDNQ